MDTSAVLEYGAPEPGETASVMADKLRFHTDAWALSADLKAKHPAIVVIDARSHDAYVQAHIPGAVSLPHREMMRASTAASRPRQGLRCLLRWDWLQRLDKGDVQALATRVPRQRAARWLGLVAPRWTSNREVT